MAIAGLHNVPVIESSILRDSQSSSSGRLGQGIVSTRASSVRQMWLELEDECAVNHVRARGRLRLQQEGNDVSSSCQEGDVRGGLEDSSESENGSVINPESVTSPRIEQDDHQSLTSEQSQDFGQVERERVRRIFQEWKNNGGTPQAPNVPHRNRGPRAQWLGETERERVRVVREWIQMTSQSGEDQVSEAGSQIEQVRDGQVLDHNEGQDNSRRRIRRLCGRQALLDLLAKKEQERRLELQGLEVTRPVSRFAHRNRIQSLLRIRCFQNMRSAEVTRSSSTAESELGLLRQRQTVSGLRGGFLSRVDNVQAQANDLSGNTPENNADCFRDDQSLASSTIEVADDAHVQIDSANDVTDIVHEQNVPADVVFNGAIQQNEPANEVLDGIHEQSDPANADVGSLADLNQPRGTQNDVGLELGSGGQSRLETATNVPASGFLDAGHSTMVSQEPFRSGGGVFSNLEETHETSRPFGTHSRVININGQLDDEVHASEDVNDHDSSIQVEDWPEQVAVFDDESRWQGSVLSSQWRDDDQAETDGQNWPGDGEEFSHGAIESEVGEQHDAQEDDWHENGSLETPRDWLGMPSSSGVASGRHDTYYFSDDDNVHHMELRELVNRRRVSSLLHSDFRESLDQLIQSYVERQTHGPDDWEELHEISLPPFTVQNQDHLSADHSEDSGQDGIHAEGSQRTLPRPPPLPQAHWGHHPNWSRNETRQRPGTEWEIINDLRIDMARLQQRLNNMQSMLEACMDMQLELQRSVRQEVSAALNRSASPSESLGNLLPKDSFKWDCVRKGICCICSNTNIDSLLYRCGHMCTCTKCADVLIQGNGKCPMCQAPVIEVIRAYFIQ